MDLQCFLFKKVLPVTLSALLICDAQLPLYAQSLNFNFKQPYYTAKQDKTAVVNRNLTIALENAKLKSGAGDYSLSYGEVSKILSAEFKNISKKQTDDSYAAYLNGLKRQDAQVAAVFNLIKHEYNPSGLISYFERKANKKGIVCEKNLCLPLNIYMQGTLRAIIYQATGQDTNVKKFKYNRDIMLSYVPAIYTILINAGVSRADIGALQKYLRYVIGGAKQYCSQDTYLADIAPGLAGGNGRANARIGKERRQNECQNIGKAMLSLGIVGYWYKDKYANASLIYQSVKDTYKKSYGAITLSCGISALMEIDTKSAYSFIDELLTKDTVPEGTTFGRIKNVAGSIWNLISVSGLASAGISGVNYARGGGGRYLNDFNQNLQYIDEDCAAAYNISPMAVEAAKNNSFIAYNLPYGNVMEDIGAALGQTQNPAGKALTAKIFSQYAALERRRPSCIASKAFNPVALETCSPGQRVHMPLVAGLLKTASGTAQADVAAKYFNTLDWWDLNEGTQRRINNISAARHFAGTLHRNLNAAKKKRSDANGKIMTLAFWTDMAASAILLGYIIESIPSIVKNASNAARVARIRISGKADLLKITRERIALGGVNPAAVKVSLAAKYRLKQAPVKRTVIRTPQARPAEFNGKGKIEFGLTDKKGNTAKVVYSQANKKIQITPYAKTRKFSGTLKEEKTLNVQIGEGSGASAARIKPAKVSATASAQKIQPAAAVQTRIYKPSAPKIIPQSRVNAAIFKANIGYAKDFTGRILRSMRTKTGGIGMLLNMSLVNPVMLNEASAGKIMPIVETLTSAEKSSFTFSSLLKESAPVYKESEAFKLASYGSDIKQFAKPDVAQVNNFFLPVKLTPAPVKYTGPSIPASVKYAFSYYMLAATMASISPMGTTKAATARRVNPDPDQKIEYFESGKNSEGPYNALTKYARQEIDDAYAKGILAKQSTINAVKETFPEISQKRIDLISSETNTQELLMLSSVISKPLFERMLCLLTSRDLDAKLQNAVKNKSIKAANKIINTRIINKQMFDRLNAAIMIKREKSDSYLTINSQMPQPKNVEEALNLIIKEDDAATSITKNFFDPKGIKDIISLKMPSLSKEAKNEILERVVKLNAEMTNLQKQGYNKKGMKAVLMGSPTEWESIDVLRPENLIISVEETKDNIGLTISKWIEKQNIPHAQGADYRQYMPQWIASELGLSAAKPGKLVYDNITRNYLIYNSDGSSRVRFGPHETNPSNAHIHIERVNTNGLWDGIVNESYPVGPSSQISAPAESARSVFEQAGPKNLSRIKYETAEVSRTFAPVALFMGSQSLYEEAKAVQKAPDKEAAVRTFLKNLDDLSFRRYFKDYLDVLQKQGLVK